MGGNALKHYNVKRIPRHEYDERRFFVESWMRVVGKYTDSVSRYFIPGQVVKDDYGDMDILFTSSNPTAVIEFFKEKFNSKGFKKNGNCTSVEWNGFQVDFIHFSPEKFRFACHYYSHGTYSAVLGKAVRYYGFKLGWDGLSYTLRVDNTKYDHLITRDWDEAMKLLKYNTTLDPSVTYPQLELFDHLVTSPLLQKHIFARTKPDRNYGFQEDFFSWIVDRPNLNKRRYSKLHGWKILFFYNPVTCGQLILKLLKMHFDVSVRPVKKWHRKITYKYLYPFALKCWGVL